MARDHNSNLRPLWCRLLQRQFQRKGSSSSRYVEAIPRGLKIAVGSSGSGSDSEQQMWRSASSGGGILKRRHRPIPVVRQDRPPQRPALLVAGALLYVFLVLAGDACCCN